MSLPKLHNHIAKIRPFLTSALLFAATAIPQYVRAAERVQTVDVDLGNAPTEVAVSTGNSMDPQFLFLLGLTVVGMIGIVGLVKDFRRGR